MQKLIKELKPNKKIQQDSQQVDIVSSIDISMIYSHKEQNSQIDIINSLKALNFEEQTQQSFSNLPSNKFNKPIKQHQSILAYIVSSCKNNPGQAQIGYMLKKRQKQGQQQLLWRDYKLIGYSTNNQAQFKAFVHALNFAKQQGIKNITVYSNNLTLIDAVNNKKKINSQKLIQLSKQCKQLSKQFDKFAIIYKERSKNSELSKLCKSF